MEAKNTYRQILKATSVFGGVQVFNVIVSIIRSKLIAVWIGPVGIGIAGLLTATMNIIGGISSLGIEMSAVKHISSHYREGEPDSVSVPVSITRRIALYTGLFGAGLSLLCCHYLSVLTFGNDSHTWSFAWLSVTILLKQLTTGELAVLQSLRRIRSLARANFYGNLIGLALSAPLYFFFRIDAIVPAIIIASFLAMVFSFVYSRQIKISKAELERKDFFREGKGILRMGIAMTFGSVLTLIASWAIQVYISHDGGTAAVGLYNAGFTLLNSYVGLLFTAMGTDYFPRLSALAEDKPRMHAAVREQSVIGILIITPIIVFFLTFADTITEVLFARNFSAIVMMVSIGIVGMLFRTVSFSIGYMVLAKADTGLFVKNAIGFNVLYFALGIAGYHYYGLAGLGMAFTLHYFFHFVVLTLIAHVKYNFTFDGEFVRTYACCMVFSAAAFAFIFIEDEGLRLLLSVAIAILSAAFSLYRINLKTDLLSFITKLNQPK